jgi:hypothetical protein
MPASFRILSNSSSTDSPVIRRYTVWTTDRKVKQVNLRPGCFPPRKESSCSRWIGGWVGPTAGVGAVKMNPFVPEGFSPWPIKIKQSFSKYKYQYTLYVYAPYLALYGFSIFSKPKHFKTSHWNPLYISE